MKLGSLFTGVGGLDLGVAQVLDVQHAWMVETDPAACKALAHHWPHVPNLGDVTQVDWREVEPVDVLTGGFPCTDVSVAGKRAGMVPGTRSGLWAHMRRAIAVLQPSLVLIENVPGLKHARGAPVSAAVVAAEDKVRRIDQFRARRNARGRSDHDERGVRLMGQRHRAVVAGRQAQRRTVRALGAVLGDLAELGFDAEWCVLPASAVGACHRRERLFLAAAHPGSLGRHGWPLLDGVGRNAPLGQQAGGDPVHEGAEPGRVELLPTPRATRGGSTTETAYALGGQRSDQARTQGEVLLPTPTASDRFGTGAHGDGGADLRTTISLLPTPTATDAASSRNATANRTTTGHHSGTTLTDALELLPTPRATDGTKGGPNQRGTSGDLMLPSAVQELLPTPTARDQKGPNQRQDTTCLHGALLPTPTAADGERSSHTMVRGNPTLLGAALVPTPLASDAGPRGGTTGYGLRDWSRGRTEWGRYAAAIERHEHVLGRPAPDPTVAGRRGGQQLNPAFVEFMDMLPDGWVTQVEGLSRNDMLRLLGNICVPAQAAAGFGWLLPLLHREAVTV